MRVESGLAEQEGKLAVKLGPESVGQPARRARRRQRRPGPMPTAVQRLFDTCKEVFADSSPGVVPSPEDVGRLRAILDNLTASDVGLSRNLPYFRTMDSQTAPPITYLHLYECEKFSIGIFCLPPSGVIPLHNHPGMTVFSKLLFGSMHIKSYDWADIPRNSNEIMKPSDFLPNGMRLAKVKTDAVFTAPCETSILYPTAGGNMHCFTARTACAVLDVLGPPYSDPEGRHCTYYSISPFATNSGDGIFPSKCEEYSWLDEREKPDDFYVVGSKYKGPKIVDH